MIMEINTLMIMHSSKTYDYQDAVKMDDIEKLAFEINIHRELIAH